VIFSGFLNSSHARAAANHSGAVSDTLHCSLNSVSGVSGGAFRFEFGSSCADREFGQFWIEVQQFLV
jgi:hypothetical protein